MIETTLAKNAHAKKQESLLVLFKKLGHFLGSTRKAQLTILLLLMFVSSFAEMLSIGAVLPFLGVLTAPEAAFKSKYLQPLIQFFDISTTHELLALLCLVFAGAILLANLLRFITLWLGTRLSFAIGFDLSLFVYRGLLYQPYAFHVSRNSNEFISLIMRAGDLVQQEILPVLNFINSCFMAAFILIALIAINWLASIVIFGGIGIVYIVAIYFMHYRLNENSQKIATESIVISKTLAEGLGGIRDVLLNSLQEIYSNVHASANSKYRRASGNNLLIGTAPHYGIEVIGILIIIGVAYFLALEPKGLLSAIPVLGAIALGAQRLMPVLQKMYSSWTEARGNRGSFQQVVELIEEFRPITNQETKQKLLPFEKEIKLEDISFSYSDQSNWILKHINLTLDKGVCYGVVGKTGGGKSTLVDIIMGLLIPTKGFLKVDGQTIDSTNVVSWQSHITHVPQAIFLSDASILENIALGVPIERIDMTRMDLAVQQSGLSEFIEKLPNGIKSSIGERGIRMSGGQRQRIGIARALYKDASVIVFDEATSALDTQTENEVMNAIYSLAEKNGKCYTIILIAHRLSTLINCNQIIEIENGEISRFGSYQEIIGRPIA